MRRDINNLVDRLEQVKLDRLNRPPEDPLSQSLEAFFRENTEDDLKELAAALVSDPV